MSQPEAGSSSVRPKMRLTKEGSNFLINYARTVNSYPQRAEKLAILASLRSIPGNESFTMPKLTNWFARHRNPSDDPNVSVLVEDEIILFPKLTRMHLQQLRVLYKKRADPSEGIIQFWAERIKADKDEIVAWIQYQQEKAKEDVRTSPESPEIPLKQLVGDDSGSASVSPTVSEFPRPHLPTPAKSPSMSPHTRMPSLPPIAVKVEESRQCVSPVSSLNTPFLSTNPKLENGVRPSEPRALEGLPPLFRLLQTAKPVPVATAVPDAFLRVGQPHHRDLAASIRDSLRPHAPPSEPPRTVDEFAAKFESVESMIDAFIKKYDSGQLVQLGWDSSLGKVTP